MSNPNYERRAKRNLQKDAEYEARRKGTRNEYYRERRLRLYSTMEGRADNLIRRYNNDDKKRGYDTSENITEQWLIDNIFTGQCAYCGETDWRKLGADRIDNKKPHTPDNIVCACGKCNVERNKKTLKDYLDYKNLEIIPNVVSQK